MHRAITGILLLDKPSGLSSNQALQQARRLYGASKAGHTGSLDPLATGLLPVCFGEATKIAGLLLGARKAYEAHIRLGVETDTLDADGRVVASHAVPVLTADRVAQELSRFIGRIQQVPPLYSALKRGGEALYRKARRGEAVEVEAREVDVFSFALLDRGADWLRLYIECGSGTYVRSLVRDLGERLGCGAHVVTLRRPWIEPFMQPAMSSLKELAVLAKTNDMALLDARLLSIEAALPALPRVVLKEAARCDLGHGRAVTAHHPEGLALAVDERGRALALVQVSAGMARPERLFKWALAQAPKASGLEDKGGYPL